MNFTIGHPQTVAPNGTAARSALPLASPKQSKRSWLPATIVTVLLSAAATIAVLFYPHPLEQSTASTKPVPATPLPADKPEVVLASTPQTSGSVISPRISDTPIERAVGSAAVESFQNAGTHFVTLRAPASILTPTGRVTLFEGTRLPLVRIKKDSVVIHYYDGNDYSIPLSAAEP